MGGIGSGRKPGMSRASNPVEKRPAKTEAPAPRKNSGNSSVADALRKLREGGEAKRGDFTP